MFLPLDPDAVGPWTLSSLGLGFSAWKTRAADTHAPLVPTLLCGIFGCSAHGLVHQLRIVGAPGVLSPAALAVAVLSQAYWVEAPRLLPGLGERRHGWPSLAVPVADLRHQPTEGQWLPTSPAVCRGGCSHLQMLGGTFQTRGPGGRSEEGDRLASPWDGTSLLCQSF